MYKTRNSLAIFALVGVLAHFTVAAASESFSGWNAFWTRDKSAGTAAIDNDTRGAKGPVICIEHKGKRDWALNRAKRMEVEAGDLIELSARVRVRGEGDAILCATTYGKDGKAVEWAYGATVARAGADWRKLRTRFVIPPGVSEIQPRVIGNRPATVWIGEFSAAKAGNVQTMRDATTPPEITVQNESLSVTLQTADGTLSVLDRRTQKVWKQQPFRRNLIVTGAKAVGKQIQWSWIHAATTLEGEATLSLDGDAPECVLTLAATGPLGRPLAFPHPFTTESGAYLIVPMNEGISYPVDDKTISSMRLIAYGGHGICMAFWGVTDGETGQMAIIETPDDAAIRIERIDGRLVIVPEWHSQKGRFGYARRLRYVFFDKGGHVAMCKRYRAHAKQIGRFKTLAAKRRENPDVDMLVGAVNVWCWERGAPALAREMQDAGIERILWSNRQSSENLKALNAQGVLTSRYDIFQDVMNPENFKFLRGVHGGWPTEAWPKDLMIGADGDWAKGWRVKAKDGRMIPCGVLCDRQAIAYAKKRISDDLKTNPYRCRFIDTTTASPYRECYSPGHPMTRSESRHHKMELLRHVSEQAHLVTGSETGHDAAVPYVHYFEGMLSLGPYRVPQAGRDMRRIWEEVPERVAKFQVGHAYRLPLWELVYHDCVIAHWYWGDYNNKLPALWDKRDLFNALYGTAPMFMFDRKLWQEQKARFARSYKATCPVARATGYAEMTDHRFLTPDHSVQQTRFANGVAVTVNFGDTSYRLADRTVVAPMKSHVVGVERE